jgi:hypothetical protein
MKLNMAARQQHLASCCRGPAAGFPQLIKEGEVLDKERSWQSIYDSHSEIARQTGYQAQDARSNLGRGAARQPACKLELL